MDLILAVAGDFQAGRLLESLIFLGVLLWRINPHLKRIEGEMHGMRNELVGVKEAMSAGFAAGEKRFENHEARIEKLETGKLAP